MTHKDDAGRLLGSHNMSACLQPSPLAVLQFTLHLATRENEISDFSSYWNAQTLSVVNRDVDLIYPSKFSSGCHHSFTPFTPTTLAFWVLKNTRCIPLGDFLIPLSSMYFPPSLKEWVHSWATACASWWFPDGIHFKQVYSSPTRNSYLITWPKKQFHFI